jgi:hypothetical protein
MTGCVVHDAAHTRTHTACHHALIITCTHNRIICRTPLVIRHYTSEKAHQRTHTHQRNSICRCTHRAGHISAVPCAQCLHCDFLHRTGTKRRLQTPHAECGTYAPSDARSTLCPARALRTPSCVPPAHPVRRTVGETAASCRRACTYCTLFVAQVTHAQKKN